MPVNRWRAIADDLRRRIERGEWAPGDQLPPHRDLMESYATTSQATLARAMAALTAEGLLVSDPRAPRRGVYVRSSRLVRRDLVAGLRMEHQRAVAGDDGGGFGLFETATGLTPGSLDVDVTYAAATADASSAAALDIAQGDPVLRRTFRYTIEGTPHQVVCSYMSLDSATAAGLVDASSEQIGLGTIAHLRRAGIYVDRVGIEMQARVPSPAEAVDLAVPPGVPVFSHQRTMYAGERPVETSIAVVAGDRVAYTLNVDLAEGSE